MIQILFETQDVSYNIFLFKKFPFSHKRTLDYLHKLIVGLYLFNTGMEKRLFRRWFSGLFKNLPKVIDNLF